MADEYQFPIALRCAMRHTATILNNLAHDSLRALDEDDQALLRDALDRLDRLCDDTGLARRATPENAGARPRDQAAPAPSTAEGIAQECVKALSIGYTHADQDSEYCSVYLADLGDGAEHTGDCLTLRARVALAQSAAPVAPVDVSQGWREQPGAAALSGAHPGEGATGTPVCAPAYPWPSTFKVLTRGELCTLQKRLIDAGLYDYQRFGAQVESLTLHRVGFFRAAAPVAAPVPSDPVRAALQFMLAYETDDAAACQELAAAFAGQAAIADPQRFARAYVAGKMRDAQAAPAPLPATFQMHVHPCLVACFGPDPVGDRRERTRLLLEEALATRS